MACFTCGKRVSHLWSKYREMIERGVYPNDACAELGLTRGCCKRMLMTHTDEISFRVMFASNPRPEFRSEARTTRTHPPSRRSTFPLRLRPEWREAPGPATAEPAGSGLAAVAALHPHPPSPPPSSSFPTPLSPALTGSSASLAGGSDSGALATAGGRATAWEPAGEVRPPWSSESWTPLATKGRA